MWQCLVNVVLGLVVIVIALGALGIGALMPFLAATFGFMGAGITVFSLWGLLEGMEKSPHFDEGAS